MRRRGLLLTFAILLSAGLIGAAFILFHPAPQPPVLACIETEPAGIVDDSGAELMLVTLRLTNTNSAKDRRGDPGDYHKKELHIQDRGTIEARVAGTWVPVDQRWGATRLSPLAFSERLFVVPHDADACRFTFDYTGSSLSAGSRLGRAVRHLPKFISSSLPAKFWRRLGWDPYGNMYQASRYWHTLTIEVPLTNVAPYPVVKQPVAGYGSTNECHPPPPVH